MFLMKNPSGVVVVHALFVFLPPKQRLWADAPVSPPDLTGARGGGTSCVDAVVLQNHSVFYSDVVEIPRWISVISVAKHTKVKLEQEPVLLYIIFGPGVSLFSNVCPFILNL